MNGISQMGGYSGQQLAPQGLFGGLFGAPLGGLIGRGIGGMFGNAVCYESGFYGAFREYIFDFFCFHFFKLDFLWVQLG